MVVMLTLISLSHLLAPSTGLLSVRGSGSGAGIGTTGVGGPGSKVKASMTTGVTYKFGAQSGGDGELVYIQPSYL